MKRAQWAVTTSLFVALTLTGVGAWGQSSPEPAEPPATPAPKLTAIEEPKLNLPPLPSGVPGAVPTDRPLTLAEAVKIALERQPQLAISGGSVQAAAGRTRQAESAANPSASLSVQYSQSGPVASGGGFGVSSGGAGSNVTLSGQQLLYDFGRTPAQIGQARDQQLSAQEAFNQARQDVASQVKQAYYTLLQNQRLVEVQTGNLKGQQAHLDLAQARFDVGVAPRADVYRAEAAVAQAQFTLMQAVTAAAQSRVDLDIAMGIDPRTPVKVQDTEEPMPPLPPIAELVEQAFRQRPEIRQLQASLCAATEALKVAQTTNKPNIFVQASNGWSGDAFPPDQWRWSAGVGVSWPFYDGGLTQGSIEAAQGNLLTAQGQLGQGQSTVSQEVVRAYLNVQSATVQVTTAAVAVKSSEESVRVSNGRYAAGVATFIEVLDAQTTLIQSQIAQVAAQYGLSLARTGLARALGEEGC